ncbi:MAG: hypothetical protein ABI383_07390, partial [Acidobacteriaceae bacterium]
QILADARAGRGGSWSGTSSDGTILFTPDTAKPLLRISSSGGAPVPVTHLSTADSENSHRWPDFLPDGKHFLYYVRSDKPENSGVFIGSLDSPDSPNSRSGRLLFRGGWPAIYAAPGYLLFPRESTLMAQRFNAKDLSLSGEAVPIAEHLTENAGSVYGVFSASQSGRLALHSLGGASGASQLAWFDPKGKSLGLSAPVTGIYLHPTLSPDGSRLAYSLFETNGVADVWVLDLARGTHTRITFGPGRQDNPVWTADGKFIFYSSIRGPFRGIFKRSADGSGAEEAILDKNSVFDSPLFVARDGSYLAFERSEGIGPHVWALPLGAGFKPDGRQPFAAGDPAAPYPSYWPSISPDGRWIAYSSSEGGPYEIYVRSFPNGPGKWQVSTGGGGSSAWRADGKELFFTTPSRQMMGVAVSSENGSLKLGTPALLFSGFPFLSDQLGAFAVAPDGKRFLLNSVTTGGGGKPLILITDWDAELKK